MYWFNGSIKEAIDKVKIADLVFLVFIQGNDDLSNKYEQYLNESYEVLTKKCIAVKISNDSVAFQQFKQIYVSVPIPSLFFIRNNGIPLDIVSSKNTSDIPKAISNIIKEKSIPQKNINENFSDYGVQGIVRGQKSQDIYNGNKGIKILGEEIKKRQEEIPSFPKFLNFNNPPPSHSSFQIKSKSHSIRIQFRLPNNDVPSWEFPDLCTLSDVKSYLREKINLNKNFKLVRAYPRTGFSAEDEYKNLVELCLTPTATLIVVPVQDIHSNEESNSSSVAQQNFIFTIFHMISHPFWLLTQFFKKHVFKIEEPNKLTSDHTVKKIVRKKKSTSNIHGFNFTDESDNDADHPDNGNSTQQRYNK